MLRPLCIVKGLVFSIGFCYFRYVFLAFAGMHPYLEGLYFIIDIHYLGPTNLDLYHPLYVTRPPGLPLRPPARLQWPTHTLSILAPTRPNFMARLGGF